MVQNHREELAAACGSCATCPARQQATVPSHRHSNLETSLQVEAKAQADLDVGMTAFRQGQLTAALVHFADAAARMPLRSKVGPACVAAMLLADPEADWVPG